jgi:CheY-like chemotaxis protein
VRKVCRAVLQAHGYHVLEADSGKSALVAYEKNAHKVDMLLTDIVMRQMDGFELARAVWQRTPGLKVLYMSGYRDHIGESDSAQPVAAFLHKPFTPDALLAKIREVLDAET